MKTKEVIQNTMSKFKTWGLLDNLTEREIESIKNDLQNIAGTAVMEANRKIQDILPNFYNELTK